MTKKHRHQTAQITQTDQENKPKPFLEFITKLEAKPWIPILFVFGAIYIFMAIRLNLSLLFTNTILTGGDSASWLQPMRHLRDVLLHHGRLFGWNQSNFFGYNEFQFYFIPPFLTGVLLSFILPATVALKIATILGVFTLPVAMYYTAKKLTKNLWAALSAAALSLIFIYNPAYTMFGGNFLSTLAGEFSYSYALTVFVFFLGVTYDTYEKKKSPLLAGLLLGLTGLCHMFVFMVAAFVPFAYLFYEGVSKIRFKWDKDEDHFDQTETVETKKDGKGKLETTIFIYVYGLLLMAFWLVPMLLTYQYSQPIAMTWHFENVKDFLIKTSFWAIILGVIIVLLGFFRSRKYRWLSFQLLYIYGACLFLYILAAFLEIPDIRFIPPALITTIFAAALFVVARDKIFKEAYDKRALFLLASLSLVTAIVFSSFIKTVSDWFNWNYTGYEAKQEYGHLQQIVTNYSGTMESGRILWEKQNQHDNADFGSERGFENLFMFTGRPSMEGIQYGSSFMARPVTYMQSEYSQNPVDPEAYRLYSKINPDVWALRFWQVNAKDIITYSPEIQKLFSENSNFTLTGVFGKFQLFTYKDFPHSYVQIVPLDRISVVRDSRWGFKTQFYRAFRDYELFDRPFVPLSFAGRLTNSCKVFEHYDDYMKQYYDTNFNFEAWRAAYPYTNSVSGEKIDHFLIQFTTTQVGVPHLIKVTYSPNFHSANGEKIYPISPGFMMIIPESPDVKITYGWNKYEIIGLILTLLLIPLAFLRRWLEKIELPLAKQLTIAAKILFFALVAFFVAESLFGARKFVKDYNRAERLVHLNRIDAAMAIVDKYANLDTLDKYDNEIIFKYYIVKAQLLMRQGKREEALQIVNYLKMRFRHTRYGDYIDYYVPR